MNNELMDEELEKLIKAKRQKKWLKLMMMLCELEDIIGEEIHHFRFDKNDIIFRNKKDELFRVSL